MPATASPYTFYDSAPDSGYSLDNLAPRVHESTTAKVDRPIEVPGDDHESGGIDNGDYRNH